jgi:hypothetical protein
MRFDIPIGTRYIFAIGAGAGVLAQVDGNGSKLIVVPIPVRLSYRIPIGETGLQVIPLFEVVPNYLRLGGQDKWGAKVGGGLKLHYGRVSSGPGVNLGLEVLGIDGTVAMITLGMAL